MTAQIIDDRKIAADPKTAVADEVTAAQDGSSRMFRETDPVKDVEALHSENAGLQALGAPRYVLSTVASVYHGLDTWLDETGQDRSAVARAGSAAETGRAR